MSLRILVLIMNFNRNYESRSIIESTFQSCFAYEQLNNKGERMGKAGKAMSLLKLFITSDDQKCLPYFRFHKLEGCEQIFLFF